MHKYIFYFSRSVTMLTLQHTCLGKDTSSAGVMSGCHHKKMVQSLHLAAICRLEIRLQETNVTESICLFFSKAEKCSNLLLFGRVNFGLYHIYSY